MASKTENTKSEPFKAFAGMLDLFSLAFILYTFKK